MTDLTTLTPALVAFLVFGAVAAGLAVATIAWVIVDTVRAPRSRPVVVVTRDRATVGAAA
jgi:hypothetical protein